MIGKPLAESDMKKLVQHMAEIDQPWVSFRSEGHWLVPEQYKYLLDAGSSTQQLDLWSQHNIFIANKKFSVFQGMKAEN